MKKLFVDVETTGLNPNVEDIIQICGILTDEAYQPIKLMNLKFSSPRIGPGILNLLGLTLDEYIEEFTGEFTEHLDEIYEILKETDFVMYAYNAPFDRNMIKRNMERNGLPVPQLDTVEVMKPKRKLGVAMDANGYNQEEVMAYAKALFPGSRGYHDATYDTVCTLLLARDMGL